MRWEYQKGELPSNAQTGYIEDYFHKDFPQNYKMYVLTLNKLKPHNSGEYQCYTEIHNNIVVQDTAILHVCKW